MRSDGRGALAAFPVPALLALLGSAEGCAEGGYIRSDGGALDPLALGFAVGSLGSLESKTGISPHLPGGFEVRGTAERPGTLAAPSPYPRGEPTREDGRRVAVRVGASGSAIAGTAGWGTG